MTSYMIRERLMWPIRMLILLASRIVGFIPGTTYGEVASMHDGPCRRCVGQAVMGPQESEAPKT